MITPAREVPPQAAMPLETPDRGIVRQLGGPGWVLFWWPLTFWLIDALSVAFLRPDAIGEPAGVFMVTSYVAVILIWVLGARPAIWQGHNKNLVRMWATVASLVVHVGAVMIGTVARVLEATVMGNENARIFITSTKGEDNTAWLGMAEYLYLFYALPVLVIVILICWFLVGRSARKV